MKNKILLFLVLLMPSLLFGASMRIGIVYTHIPVNQPIRMSFLANDKIQKTFEVTKELSEEKTGEKFFKFGFEDRRILGFRNRF